MHMHICTNIWLGFMSTGVGPTTGCAQSRKGRPTSVRPWPLDGTPPRASSLPFTSSIVPNYS
eukprot:1665328-Pleurochrysis_carterae.AAC.1